MKKLDKNTKVADRALYALGKKVEILNHLSWPKSKKNLFLKSWRKNNPKLPEIERKKLDLSSEKETLKQIIKRNKSKDPLAILINETAKSFMLAFDMLESNGKKNFFNISCKLYGQPKDLIEQGNTSTYKIASKLLKSLKKFNLQEITPTDAYCILADSVVEQIRLVAKEVGLASTVDIVTDKKISAKATASPTKIKIREGTCFAPHDIDQLIQHELLVHSLTAINGRKQKIKTLGLNSPRTTVTQEGLAVFSEFITNSMDVKRLQRVSSRVIAIQMAIDGADFLDVFKHFLEYGQSEEESYYSTQRIFRGGNVKGRYVFTKDQVYLKGFIEVHQFFYKSLKDKNFSYPLYLMSGRLCTSDIKSVAPYFKNGTLVKPLYKPKWIEDRSTLLAFLLSSSIIHGLGIQGRSQ